MPGKWQVSLLSPGAEASILLDSSWLISLFLQRSIISQTSHLLSLRFYFRCFWIADPRASQGSTEGLSFGVARMMDWRGIDSLHGPACLKGTLQALNIRDSIAPWKVSAEDQEVLQSLLGLSRNFKQEWKGCVELSRRSLLQHSSLSPGRNTEPDSYPLENALYSCRGLSIALLHAMIYFCPSRQQPNQPLIQEIFLTDAYPMSVSVLNAVF